MKVAIVHYWLVSMRGGKKVVEALCELFAQADVFIRVYCFNKLVQFLALVVLGFLIFTVRFNSFAQTPLLISPTIPNGFGVNIHFTDPKPGEMKMLAGAGFSWVRMDFNWSRTEVEKGKYNFTALDRLLAALKPYRIRPLFILVYANRFYDNGQSPHTENGRQAFARWAAASVQRFQGHGILWEMYNEPNIHFWSPKPNVNDYIKLALAVGKAIRKVSPGESYIGPATARIDFPFLEACFKAGLLEYWSAVSVHPYRKEDPETAAADFRRLRFLIAKYAPKGKKVPIISGEWGYSTAWVGMKPEKQGKMLPRQWLSNLVNDVPLSIWYDWHDDGPNPKDPEHRFGIVRYPYRSGHNLVYQPKHAYNAARTLTAILRGYRFNKRLAIGRSNDYVLLFSKGSDVRLAVWTTSQVSRNIVIPVRGHFQVTAHTGERLTPLTARQRGLSIKLTDAPQYLVPDKPNALLSVAAA